MADITLVSVALGKAEAAEVPLGPLYVAASLEAAGIEVDFRDHQLCPGADHASVDHLLTTLNGHAPVVGLSCFSDALPLVIAAVRELRAADRDVKVILGGPGPTAVADLLLQRFPEIDAVVRGEGEEAAVEVLRALQDGEPALAAGVSTRHRGRIWHGP